MKSVRRLCLVLGVVVLLAALASASVAASAALSPKAKYQITRCELKAGGKVLELDLSDRSGKLVRTFKIRQNKEDGYYLIKALNAQTQFTVPRGWLVDCDPAHAEGLNGAKPEKLEDVGGIRFSAGKTVYFKDSTGMTLWLIDEDAVVGGGDEPEIPSTPIPATLDSRAQYILTRWELMPNGKLELDISDRNGKLAQTWNFSLTKDGGDSYYLVKTPKTLPGMTQFVVPEGWMIDCNARQVEGLTTPGEPLPERKTAVRFFSGDGVLFTKRTGMTIRQNN